MTHNQPRLSRTEQPVYAAMRASGLSMSKVAEAAGVPYIHLRQAAKGFTRPNLRLRAKLPEILGRPIEALFEPASLVAPLASEACTCDSCTLKRIKRERALLARGQQ